MLTELGKMNKHSEDFNEELENGGKYQKKVIMVQLKDILEEFNSRLGEAEEQSNEVEDKAWELSLADPKKEKKTK